MQCFALVFRQLIVASVKVVVCRVTVRTEEFRAAEKAGILQPAGAYIVIKMHCQAVADEHRIIEHTVKIGCRKVIRHKLHKARRVIRKLACGCRRERRLL